ncbi:MAG: thiamine-biosynthesis protein ThiS [Betaproteobacteria bacterium]|nr:thiamine-biosynthesis protein ThiS [Betaproteobacteria bacterium]
MDSGLRQNDESSIYGFRQMVTITINGERREFAQAVALAQLVEALGLAGKRIAIERNGEIVPRGQFAAHAIADGDRLEIVVAVGGG